MPLWSGINPLQSHPEAHGSQSPEDTAERIAREAAEFAKHTAKRGADSAEEAIHVVEDAASEVANVTMDAVGRASNTAKDFCRSTAMKSEKVLDASCEYVRRYPVPSMLGSIALGAARERSSIKRTALAGGGAVTP